MWRYRTQTSVMSPAGQPKHRLAQTLIDPHWHQSHFGNLLPTIVTFLTAEQGLNVTLSVRASPNGTTFQHVYKTERFLRYSPKKGLRRLLSQGHPTTQFSNFPLFRQTLAEERQGQRVSLWVSCITLHTSRPKILPG